MPRSVIATLVASTAGFATIRHARRMLHDGVDLDAGGGWTAVIMAEVMITLTALAIAVY
jgi:hypothetical protein